MDVKKIYQSFSFDVEGNGGKIYTGLLTFADFNPLSKEILIDYLTVATVLTNTSAFVRSGAFYLQSEQIISKSHAMTGSGADPPVAITNHPDKIFFDVEVAMNPATYDIGAVVLNDLALGFSLILQGNLAAGTFMKFNCSIGYKYL